MVDVDDTLCLTEAVCFELENEVLRGIGRPVMAREVHLSTWGQPLLQAIRERSPGVDVARFAAAYSIILQEYVAAGRIDSVVPENLDALDRLAASGRSVALLTSRTEAEVAHLIAPAHPLTGRISATYHDGNVRFGKPDPRAFDELLAATGLCPAECVYVGDSPSDARAASGAGLYFIACLQSGVRQRGDFDARQVDAFVDTFPAIVDIIDRLERAGRPEAG